MKQTKVYPCDLEEKGFVRATWHEMNKCQLDKSAYVEMFLSPAVINAKCGWYLGNVQSVTNSYHYCQRCGQAIDWSDK